MTPTIRKGQAPETLQRAEFHERFMQPFQDPAFQAEAGSLHRIELIAWEAYQEGRKAPVTRKAGPGYADPDYDLSVDWLEAKARIDAAQAAWGQPQTRSRVLLVNGSPRNDGTCPGEISKTWRLAELAREVLEGSGIQVDLLDLSLVTSEYGRQIHPCKGCVSTAMPLCHWPCSCYPNHSLRQTGDWMNEIYERWVAAHGVIVLTPTHWYQATSPLKLMIDRLVCADGGNPTPAARTARSQRRPRRSSSKAGATPSTWTAAPTAWWCTATWPASRACGATCATGSTGWAWSTPACSRGWTATSATTSPTPPATTNSTPMPTCRKKCATWRVPSRARWASCARARCRRPTAG
jgi:multimeric flavodoxin WrbA